MNLRSILYGALTRIAFVAAAALLMTAQASAEVQPARWSSLSLTFLQPTGVAGPSDSIDVWLRFANTDPTGAFTVDNSLPNGGLNSADLPRQGWGTDAGGTSIYADFSSYTNFSLATWFGCSGTFTKTCTDGPPYSFTWASGSPLAVPFSLAPGQTLDYLHGSFIPSAGPVAAGNYNFYRSLISIDVNGLDAVGNDLRQLVYLNADLHRRFGGRLCDSKLLHPHRRGRAGTRHLRDDGAGSGYRGLATAAPSPVASGLRRAIGLTRLASSKA